MHDRDREADIDAWLEHKRERYNVAGERRAEQPAPIPGPTTDPVLRRQLALETRDRQDRERRRDLMRARGMNETEVAAFEARGMWGLRGELTEAEKESVRRLAARMLADPAWAHIHDEIRKIVAKL